MARERDPLAYHGGEYSAIQQAAARHELQKFLPDNILAVQRKKDKAVSLVLSGGGALSPVHIGVVGALLENGIPIDIITGTSAGAIGAITASRCFTLDHWLKAKEMAQKVNWDQVSQPGDVRRGGLVSLNRLSEFINKNIQRFGQKADQAPTPILITVVDITDYKKILRVQWEPIPGSTWGDMVQASSSIPGVMEPTRVAGYVLWDGGAVTHEGYEAIGVARTIVPDALQVSVRLAYIGDKKYTSKSSADVSITPCVAKRASKTDMAIFDSRDVVLGYMGAQEKIDEILLLMKKRNIHQVFRPGFRSNSRWQLYNNYLHRDV